MQGQLVMQADRVDRGVDAARGEQCLGVGGEPQSSRVTREVERFDAETVAGQEQPSLGRVPDREREHAVQSLDALLAPGMVRLDDDLAVAVGEEVIAGGTQFVAQLRVVVDGAVEHQRQAQLGIDQRLAGAVREVDDCEALVAEGERPVGVAAGVVGAAPLQAPHHAADRAEVGGALVEAQLAADSAHGFSPWAGRMVAERRAATPGGN